MQRKIAWAICSLILGALAAAVPLRAQGDDQGKPPSYTYVSEWALPRAQWKGMAKVNEDDRSVNEKLLADGTITGYGEFENLIHVEGEPTHGSWFTATSEGNVLKALEAFYARPGLTSPVLGSGPHWDYFLVSRLYNGRSGVFDGAYLSGSEWDVEPGQGEAFHNMLKTRLVPVFEKLVADGVLVSYSVNSEDYHTQKPGRVSLVTITADASAVDKVDDALEAAFSKDPEIGPAFRSLTDSAGHRDFLLRVTHMSVK
jgi:hypothetical protein